ncbi:hypothetical protein PHYBOEH_008306 [Phytophthora boehmeriae]|uniref:Uncharacterized protein n=1 Tax=Phytophthora boehmeriae TaxID=109152 RepID=A0A8T1X6J8_9STRA|nr:hypothetical protein PHYBOEH_008306 [Phytophthora boehmeriae]
MPTSSYYTAPFGDHTPALVENASNHDSTGLTDVSTTINTLALVVDSPNYYAATTFNPASCNHTTNFVDDTSHCDIAAGHSRDNSAATTTNTPRHDRPAYVDITSSGDDGAADDDLIPNRDRGTTVIDFSSSHD